MKEQKKKTTEKITQIHEHKEIMDNEWFLHVLIIWINPEIIEWG